LWKQKNETGQWIEVEPEAMSACSEFPPFNLSGIMFMGDNMKHNMETMYVSNGDADGEEASKAGINFMPKYSRIEFPPFVAMTELTLQIGHIIYFSPRLDKYYPGTFHSVNVPFIRDVQDC
jgi:hypothetical protein